MTNRELQQNETTLTWRSLINSDKLWIKLKDVEGAISKASLRRDLLSPESSLPQLDLGDLGVTSRWQIHRKFRDIFPSFSISRSSPRLSLGSTALGSKITATCPEAATNSNWDQSLRRVHGSMKTVEKLGPNMSDSIPSYFIIFCQYVSTLINQPSCRFSFASIRHQMCAFHCQSHSVNFP